MRTLALILFAVLASVFSANAQPLPPPPPNMAVPLDTVVVLLIIAGVAFGAYKLKANSKKTLAEA